MTVLTVLTVLTVPYPWKEWKGKERRGGGEVERRRGVSVWRGVCVCPSKGVSPASGISQGDSWSYHLVPANETKRVLY